MPVWCHLTAAAVLSGGLVPAVSRRSSHLHSRPPVVADRRVGEDGYFIAGSSNWAGGALRGALAPAGRG
ncbi:hypothetical protein F4560_002453 [Saccharothrix ecbatanensis]|uniref:Uncharacterized protein n=1 Tax=Saccharothrix ecbatanensis TaxID=1105145 RepID=A0A7W9HIC1_9PSEU|nr:hypothetical protein [Saccharothrix ecbatanensis]MBB5802685.1 hypothetical protein [Saccharothrix ecbatanensis]